MPSIFNIYLIYYILRIAVFSWGKRELYLFFVFCNDFLFYGLLSIQFRWPTKDYYHVYEEAWPEESEKELPNRASIICLGVGVITVLGKDNKVGAGELKGKLIFSCNIKQLPLWDTCPLSGSSSCMFYGDETEYLLLSVPRINLIIFRLVSKYYMVLL